MGLRQCRERDRERQGGRRRGLRLDYLDARLGGWLRAAARAREGGVSSAVAELGFRRLRAQARAALRSRVGDGGGMSSGSYL